MYINDNDSLVYMFNNSTQEFFPEYFNVFTEKNTAVGKFQSVDSMSFMGEFNSVVAQWLCDDNKADGLIYIDKFYMAALFYELYGLDAATKGKYYMENLFKSGIKIFNGRTGNFTHDFSMEGKWGFYEKKLPEDTVADNYPDLIKNISSYVADSSFSYISPYWKTNQRKIVVTENSGFKTAWKMAGENKWDEALAEWKKYENCKSKRVRNFALYNMAVYFEYIDNLAKADSLMSVVNAETKSPLFIKYQKTLSRRFVDRRVLKVQMGN